MFAEDSKPGLLISFMRDIIHYLPSKVIPILVGILTIPIITHLFSPQEFGDYNLTITIVTLFSILPTTLWGNSAIRFFNKYRERSVQGLFFNTIVWGSIICVILILMVYFILLMIIKNFISVELYNLLIIGSILFILTSMFNVLTSILNIRQEAKEYTIFYVSQIVIGLLIGVAIVLFLKSSIAGLVWGSIISMIITLPPLYYLVFKGITTEIKFSKIIASEMVLFSFPLIFANIATWILSLSCRYIIEFYKGSYDVGIFSASYTIVDQVLNLILNLLMLAGYPLILQIWEKKGQSDTQEIIKNFTRYYIILCLPATMGLSILSKDIVEIFTSPEYYIGYKIIPFVAFGIFFMGLQWWPQVGLLLNKKTNMVMYSFICICAVNIIINIIIIPIYGYIGAAISTFISYALLLLIITVVSSKVLVWKFPFKSYINVLFASSIMCTAIYILNNILINSDIINISIKVLLGAIVYFVILTLIGEVKLDYLYNYYWLKRVDNNEQ